MQTEWIQVTDRLPEEHVDVLIYVLEDGTNYRVAARVDDAWMTPGWRLIQADNVTHWQPLAPPTDGAAPAETPWQDHLRQTSG